MTAIVGDVHAKELIPILETYFGRIPARPKPAPLRTVEPPQVAVVFICQAAVRTLAIWCEVWQLVQTGARVFPTLAPWP